MVYRLRIQTKFQRWDHQNAPNCFRRGITEQFDNHCPTKTSAIPANPLMIELGSRTEDDSGGKLIYREAVGSPLWLANVTRPDIVNLSERWHSIATALAKST